MRCRIDALLDPELVVERVERCALVVADSAAGEMEELLAAEDDPRGLISDELVDLLPQSAGLVRIGERGDPGDRG